MLTMKDIAVLFVTLASVGRARAALSEVRVQFANGKPASFAPLRPVVENGGASLPADLVPLDHYTKADGRVFLFEEPGIKEAFYPPYITGKAGQCAASEMVNAMPHITAHKIAQGKAIVTLPGEQMSLELALPEGTSINVLYVLVDYSLGDAGRRGDALARVLTGTPSSSQARIVQAFESPLTGPNTYRIPLPYQNERINACLEQKNPRVTVLVWGYMHRRPERAEYTTRVMYSPGATCHVNIGTIFQNEKSDEPAEPQKP